MEADARRLQCKEEELMKRKQDIRSHLSQLKKDRRDMKAALEASTGEPHPDPGRERQLIALVCVAQESVPTLCCPSG